MRETLREYSMEMSDGQITAVGSDSISLCMTAYTASSEAMPFLLNHRTTDSIAILSEAATEKVVAGLFKMKDKGGCHTFTAEEVNDALDQLECNTNDIAYGFEAFLEEIN